MPARIALLGAKEGPWVDVRRVARPALRVSGLRDGAVKVWMVLRDRTEQALDFASDGSHRLPDGLDWLKITCSIQQTNLCCEVVTAAKAA